MSNLQTGSMVKTSNHIHRKKQVNEVYVTTDYSMFKTKQGNRNLNELHFKRLLSSIQENDLLSANPILINEHGEIIDGQHRFKVCVELGKPIYYIVAKGLGLREIQILNANAKTWKMEDYVDGFCAIGLDEYCYLKHLMNSTQLGITILLGIFASGMGNGNTTLDLRNGQLKLPHKKRGLIMLQWIKDWEQYYIGANRRTFVLALVQLYDIKEYSHERMMQKIKYQSAKLVDCTNTKTYVALLEEIYNYKERNEKVRFF